MNQYPHKNEIEPDVDRQGLIQLILNGICEKELYLKIKSEAQFMLPFPSHVSHLSFDNIHDIPIPGYYIQLEDDIDIPFGFLISVLKESNIPLLFDDGWFAWDIDDQVLRTKQPSTKFLWDEVFSKKRLEFLDDDAKYLVQMLYRSLLSTDHGKKPVILKSEFLQNAVECKEFVFENARNISIDNIHCHAIAFYDCVGKPKALPLGLVAKLGLPVSTRSCTYRVDGDILSPILNYSTLLSSAFYIARRYDPKIFMWFKIRGEGTVFHSIIERIETPADLDFSSLFSYKFKPGENFLAFSKILRDRANDYGPIYFSINGHPLDTDLITTPELYMHAVKTIYNNGFWIDRSCHGQVCLEKDDGWTIDDLKF